MVPRERWVPAETGCLLAEVRYRSTVPTLVATDLLRLAENLGHLPFVADGAY